MMLARSWIGFSLVSAFGLLLAGSHAQEAKKDAKKASEMKTFSPTEEFSFRMPAEPKNIDRDEQGIKIKMWVYESKDDGAMLIAYNQLPGKPKGDEIKTVLEGAMNGQATGMGGKLVASKDAELDKKYPGIAAEGTIKVQGMNGIYQSRIYLVEDRMYQVLVLGSEKFVKSKEAKEFIESLSLRKDK